MKKKERGFVAEWRRIRGSRKRMKDPIIVDELENTIDCFI